MSTALEAASLIMIPTSYSDGLLASAKPNDGAGDFTFTRGSNLSATRINADGYIEKGYENLLPQSNAFDNAAWTKTRVDLTSGQTGYDGTNDAWLVTNNNDSFPRLEASVTSNGVSTYSVYVKAGTNSFCQLRTGAISDAWFDLSNGSIISASGTGLIDTNSEEISNGWYRLSLIVNGTLTGVRIYSASAFGVYGLGSIYIQDAMVNQGLVAYPYVETIGAPVAGGILEDTPRIDFSGGNQSLLLEPERTNKLRYSEYYGSNLLVNSSIDINNTKSPEGVQNATLLIENTSSGNHSLREAVNIGLAGDDSQYVISFYAKSNGRNIRFIDDAYAGSSTIVDFNITSGGTLNNGSLVIDSDAVAFGDGWYYCYAVIDKVSAGQNSFRFSLRLLGGASNNNDSYTGNGQSGAWIWGKQIEDAVSYPTSYIPNHSGGSVTRGGETTDVLTLPETLTDNYTLFFDFKEIIAPNGWVKFTDSSNNEVYSFYGYSGHYDVRNGSSFIVDASADPDGKIALQQSGSSVKIFVNGVDKTKAGATANLNDIVKFAFGSHPSTNTATLNQMLVFNEALSDADCITITSL